MRSPQPTSAMAAHIWLFRVAPSTPFLAAATILVTLQASCTPKSITNQAVRSTSLSSMAAVIWHRSPLKAACILSSSAVLERLPKPTVAPSWPTLKAMSSSTFAAAPSPMSLVARKDKKAIPQMMLPTLTVVLLSTWRAATSPTPSVAPTSTVTSRAISRSM